MILRTRHYREYRKMMTFRFKLYFYRFVVFLIETCFHIRILVIDLCVVFKFYIHLYLITNAILGCVRIIYQFKRECVPTRVRRELIP